MSQLKIKNDDVMMMMMIFINVLCGPPEGYEDVLS